MDVVYTLPGYSSSPVPDMSCSNKRHHSSVFFMFRHHAAAAHVQFKCNHSVLSMIWTHVVVTYV